MKAKLITCTLTSLLFAFSCYSQTLNDNKNFGLAFTTGAVYNPITIDKYNFFSFYDDVESFNKYFGDNLEQKMYKQYFSWKFSCDLKIRLTEDISRYKLF